MMLGFEQRQLLKTISAISGCRTCFMVLQRLPAVDGAGTNKRTIITFNNIYDSKQGFSSDDPTALAIALG